MQAQRNVRPKGTVIWCTASFMCECWNKIISLNYGKRYNGFSLVCKFNWGKRSIILWFLLSLSTSGVKCATSLAKFEDQFGKHDPHLFRFHSLSLAVNKKKKTKNKKNAWHKKTWDSRSTSAPESSSPSAVISQDIFYSNYRQTNCWHSMLMPLFWLKRLGKHTMKSRGLCAMLKKHSSIASSVKCEKNA